MALPVDILGEVTKHLSFSESLVMNTCCKELNPIAWNNTTEAVFTPHNVVALATKFASLPVCNLRKVTFQDCFFPVWLGVPTFVSQLTEFSWTVPEHVHVRENAPPTRLPCYKGDNPESNGQLDPNEDNEAREFFLRHVRAWLAALNPAILEVCVLDNFCYHWHFMGRATEPLFGHFCDAPMTRLHTFRMRHVIIEGQTFDFALLERMCETWTMPNAVVLEFDAIEPDDALSYNDALIRFHDHDEGEEFEKLESLRLRFGDRILGPVISRCDPTRVQRVILRRDYDSSERALLNGLGRWRPRDIPAAISAIEAWYGQDYRKLGVQEDECLCESLVNALVHGHDMPKRARKVHNHANCRYYLYHDKKEVQRQQKEWVRDQARKEFDALPIEEQRARADEFSTRTGYAFFPKGFAFFVKPV